MPEKITFDQIPDAIAYLIKEIEEVRAIVEQINKPVQKKSEPIDIDAASKIIMKAKPTIYALVRKRLIPHYKIGNKLYFLEDELLAWINEGKRKSTEETTAQIEAEMLRTVRHKPRTRTF